MNTMKPIPKTLSDMKDKFIAFTSLLSSFHFICSFESPKDITRKDFLLKKKFEDHLLEEKR